MKLRSVARRLAVAMPFFAIAAVLLAAYAAPVRPGACSSPHPSPSGVLIITPEALRSPFEALETWNQSQGCPTYVITLQDNASSEMVEGCLTYLGALCAMRGVTRVLLGGDKQLVPVGWKRDLAAAVPRAAPAAASPAPRVVPVPVPPGSRIPDGLRMGRAPVGNLDEAWAFVEACRVNGQTLDRLIHSEDVPMFVTFLDGRALTAGAAALRAHLAPQN